MRANNVLGIIYSNAYDSALHELTNLRTMGSVPFGGRYRLIDFPLSSMVNCGISKVGVITKSNYRSLMDHLGTGKPWDLSRKREGMYILPPFSSFNSGGVYRNRIEALHGSLNFISRSNEEYLIMCDCNVVCMPDYQQLLDAHTRTSADITIAYMHGRAPALDDVMTLSTESDGRVIEVALDQKNAENAIVVEEHMLRAAKADAFGTEVARGFRVGWRIRVRTYAELPDFVRPLHQRRKFAR